MCELRLLFVSRQVIVILSCCKPSQAVFIYVQAKGVNASERHIDSEVEFETIEEQGIVDVLTHDVGGPLLWDLCQLVCNDYTLPLGGGRWLSDPKLLLIFLHLRL